MHYFSTNIYLPWIRLPLNMNLKDPVHRSNKLLINLVCFSSAFGWVNSTISNLFNSPSRNIHSNFWCEQTDTICINALGTKTRCKLLPEFSRCLSKSILKIKYMLYRMFYLYILGCEKTFRAFELCINSILKYRAIYYMY